MNWRKKCRIQKIPHQARMFIGMKKNTEDGQAEIVRNSREKGLLSLTSECEKGNMNRKTTSLERGNGKPKTTAYIPGPDHHHELSLGPLLNEKQKRRRSYQARPRVHSRLGLGPRVMNRNCLLSYVQNGKCVN